MVSLLMVVMCHHDIAIVQAWFEHRFSSPGHNTGKFEALCGFVFRVSSSPWVQARQFRRVARWSAVHPHRNRFRAGEFHDS
jgi:hypothetical protein